MAKFKVYFARTTWLTATVEADDEDAAVESAYDVLPPFSANESGWGSKDWSADADEWQTIDEFHGKDYEPKRDGPVVKEA